LKLSRDDQSQYSYNKNLINNQIIKYHRSTDPELFPRLRISLDESDPNNLARNFLQPNHEYEVSVKAHNLDVDTTQIGGLSLGLWIHTDPELDQVWSYKPDGIYDNCNQAVDTWVPLNVADLSSTGGINMAVGNAQTRSFRIGSLEDLVGSGEGASNQLGPITEDVYDYRCFDPVFITTTIPGANPQAIANIGPDSAEVLKFKFSTKNNWTIKPTAQYLAQRGYVHRKNQKYTLEFFVPVGNESKFVVFEEISIKDITNYNKAVIRTQYGDAQLDLKDLKAVCRFFKGLSNGLAARNSTITSGTMEVSGGSRLNYRSNSSMFPTTEDATYKQLEDIQIYEG
jgi:hypothetical protein